LYGSEQFGSDLNQKFKEKIKMTDIGKFCKLVKEINELNEKLELKLENFYYGGTSFDEVYADDIDKITVKENELEEILNKIKPSYGGDYTIK
jgi:hypothetical protein